MLQRTPAAHTKMSACGTNSIRAQRNNFVRSGVPPYTKAHNIAGNGKGYKSSVGGDPFAALAQADDINEFVQRRIAAMA
jgi:hypothetical protein